MDKPKPIADIVVEQNSNDPYSLRIYTASLEAETWVAEEADAFGIRSKAGLLFIHLEVSRVYDPNEVACYLEYGYKGEQENGN